jgi:hypothetical protein
MTDALHRDIDWLTTRLAEVEPATTVEALDRLRDRIGGVAPGADRPDLGDLSLEEIAGHLSHLAIAFHLRNKAEQHHIVRVNRRRELAATAEAPRAESIEEACRRLAARGRGGRDLEALLSDTVIVSDVDVARSEPPAFVDRASRCAR